MKVFDYAARFVGAKQGQSRKSAGLQRFALVLFGAIFAVLVIGFAIAQGIGQPSIPSGAIAVVEEVPDDIGTLTEAEFKRALLQQASQGGLKKIPKPGDSKYEELKTATIGSMLDSVWIQGEAEEIGIEVTPKQIATELEQIKEQNFKAPGAYEKFLKTSHFSEEDVNDRVRLQLLSTQIQETITQGAAPASNSEIEDYYNAGKATQYTTPASRDVRLIVNKDAAKTEAAKALLEKDDSPASWKKVALKYSTDPSTKSKGGLQAGIAENLIGEPLGKEIFAAAQSVMVGPVKYKGSNYVLEVVKVTPSKQQALGEVRSQISSQLTQQIQQEFFSEFVTEYRSKWQSRTFCASSITDGIESTQVRDELAKRCANVTSSGHSASAQPGCYEADPKGGLPKDCPAPVAQLAPAIPGSVNVLKPQGERLPQRPRPEGLEEAAAESGIGLPEGVEPGAVEAPPSGE